MVTGGDGGFNAPWSWHYPADSVTVPMVIQPCPSEIAADPAAWSGKYVVQTGQLIRRVQQGATSSCGRSSSR